MSPVDDARWWGWGDAAPPPPPPGLLAVLGEIGVDGTLTSQPVPLDAVRLPSSTLDPGLRGRLAAVVGDDHVRPDRLSRVRHARGRSYLDLLRLRAGDAETAPDAVVHPATAGEVGGVVAACDAMGAGLVPFGGGTSVVGGVTPDRRRHGQVVTVDLGRLSGLAVLDTTALTATLAAGTRGPDVERALGARGLTLGHFPQSFELATLGGFVATRSAGQASTGFGAIADMVIGLRCATPRGEVVLDGRPASATGPSLLDMVVGSEGMFGVITEATVEVRRVAVARRYEGWSFPSFAAGVEALRILVQEDSAADVARLSDEEETRVTMAASGGAGLLRSAGERLLQVRGHGRGSLLIIGWEGAASTVGRRRSVAAAVLHDCGALPLGQAPGRAWLRSRYEAPHLRDALLDRGVLAETLETATTWTRLAGVHHATVTALSETLRGFETPALVGAHVSHLYRSGASLYFTVLARQAPGRAVEQWQAAKTAATEALLDAGGVLSHHHGVGSDHADWMGRAAGEAGLIALRALKAALDPHGVMNPGKVLSASSAAR